MANYTLLIPHMLKWEGGYSSDPDDTASSFATKTKLNGHPIHTNKGITFQTWVSTSNELGHPKTEQAFLNMTSSQWGKIMKKFYWDKVYGDKIKSQAIAEILTEIVWGSGVGGLKQNVILLQKFLKDAGYKIEVDGSIGPQTVDTINKYVTEKGKAGENRLYDLIWQSRANQLKNYKSAWKHLNGWMNRMNDHYKSAMGKLKELVTDNPIKSGIVSVFLIVGAIFFLTKKFKK